MLAWSLLGSALRGPPCPPWVFSLQCHLLRSLHAHREACKRSSRLTRRQFGSCIWASLADADLITLFFFLLTHARGRQRSLAYFVVQRRRRRFLMSLLECGPRACQSRVLSDSGCLLKKERAVQTATTSDTHSKQFCGWTGQSATSHAP